MRLTRATTGTPWEKQVGYARAVRGGPWVAVSGTVASDGEGRPVAADAHGQTRAVLETIDGALRRLGSRLDHVLRLRVYYADPAVGGDVTRALREVFGAELPALTAVRVTALVDPAFLVEVEADALVADWAADPTVPRLPEEDEGVD